MPQPSSFKVRESGAGRRPKSITEKLVEAGFSEATDDSTADIVICHEATDWLEDDARDQLLGRRGVYVEYGGGKGAWENCGEGWYRGSDGELLARLSLLPRNATIEDLRHWLRPGDELLKLSFSRSMAVLCQGYLAVHWAAGGGVSAPVDKALKDMGCSNELWLLVDDRDPKRLHDDLARQRTAVQDPSWWKRVLGEDRGKLMSTLLKELNVDAKHVKAIMELISALYDSPSGPNAEIVASAYLEVAERVNK